MRSRSRVFAVLAAFALPLVSQAQDPRWYVGLSAGVTDWDDYHNGYGAELFEQHEERRGTKAILGYRATDWLAIEANYTDFGSLEGNLAVACIPEQVCGGHVIMDGRAASVSGLAGLEAGSVYVFARAGLTRWEAERVSLEPFATFGGEAHTTLLLGMGAEWRLRALAVRLELERQDMGSSDVSLVSVGALWSFGG